MYQIGEAVVEKHSGLCQIQDIREEDFMGRGAVLYYVLQPFHDKGALVYVPAYSVEEKLRPLHRSEELKSYIENVKAKSMAWNNNDKERQQKFQSIVKEGTMEEQLLLMKTLIEKRKELVESGKKFRAVDERVLHELEMLVLPEVKQVLGMEAEELIKQLGNDRLDKK